MINQDPSRYKSYNDLYQKILGPILSRDSGIDAEQLSEASLCILQYVSRNRKRPLVRSLINLFNQKLVIKDERLIQTIFGCNFTNPIGLAAGFDKNGVAAGLWNYFGFGFAELGTVTMHAQYGNPKPRLFRLSAEEAALNRMGFNNLGAEKLLRTLTNQNLEDPGKRPIIIGINLGKSKITPLEKASEDYLASFKTIVHQADYIVINVSSPNTPGLRSLQETNQLRKIINTLKRIGKHPPLLLKISPDLTNQAIDQIAIVAKEENLAGLIATNTSISRHGLEERVLTQTRELLSSEQGGLSGLPIQKRALEVIDRLNSVTKSDIPLIGVGGINSAQSAWERIAAGASLIQLYTGWIYKGPSLVPTIIEGIISQLEKNGFNSISEAIGCKEPWK